MKNQSISMLLAWAVSVGLIPESTSQAITNLVGIQGYERPFEFAMLILLGFLIQTLKPLWSLLPLWTQSYANRVSAEFDLISDAADSVGKPIKKPARKKTTASASASGEQK
jgi:hypothetical protein